MEEVTETYENGKPLVPLNSALFSVRVFLYDAYNKIKDGCRYLFIVIKQCYFLLLYLQILLLYYGIIPLKTFCMSLE